MNLQSNSSVQVCENPIESLVDLERKIDSVTKTLSKPYYNKILKDLLRSNLVNAQTIIDYILVEQTEINIKDSTKESKIKTLVWLSNFHNNKKFIDLSKEDILDYLNNSRKTTTEDPSNRWIGTHNGRHILLSKFFKWLYFPNNDHRERPIPV